MAWWHGLTRLERMIRRAAAYADVFGAREADRTRSQLDVLQDLSEFCGGVKPPYRGDNHGRGDPMATGIAIGRQEVYFRICELARITPAQIRAYAEAAEAPPRSANQGESDAVE